MSRYRSTPLDCKVYVGELGNNGTRHELEDAFSYYGPLKNVSVARNPPGFAFVEFEDSRDARDAVRALDGKMVCGRRVRVELSSGKPRSGYRPQNRFNNDQRCYDCGERGHFARDCRNGGGGGGGGSSSRRGGGGSSGSRRGGRYSRSRSRSPSRSKSRRSKSASRSRSGSRNAGTARSRSRSRSRSASRSR